MTTYNRLTALLHKLRLRAIVDVFEEMAARAERESWSFTQYLEALVDIEVDERQRRRIKRHLKESSLPDGKTLATMDMKYVPVKVRRSLDALCRGDFISSATNIMAFGLPGRGKTHICAAIGAELVRQGYRVYFTPTYQLVQRLLVAKRELELERALKKLDRFDVVILDDLGYIQQDRDEMEVLFTFLAARYERKSIMITSNLVFSKYIFGEPVKARSRI